MPDSLAPGAPSPPPVTVGRQPPIWLHGPPLNRRGTFYATHGSGCQRLVNGNTLITLMPLGTLLEVTPSGSEVWRYVSPLCSDGNKLSTVRQGDQRVGRFSLFRALRYAPDHAAFSGRELAPYRYLEG